MAESDLPISSGQQGWIHHSQRTMQSGRPSISSQREDSQPLPEFNTELDRQIAAAFKAAEEAANWDVKQQLLAYATKLAASRK